MKTRFRELHNKHTALIQKTRTREMSQELLVTEAKELIQELLEAEREITDENDRQRLESYATYWGSVIFEITGLFPQISQGLRTEPTIGIITALPKEYVAVKAMLKNPREYTSSGPGTVRQYLLGDIPSSSGGMHTVVLSLTAMGNSIASARVTLLLEHFPSVTLIIMTGIAGGIPYPEKPDEHVRLGDIVVSNQGGVVRYDFDKKEGVTEFIHRYPPRPPSATLLEAVSLLNASELEGIRPWSRHIKQAMNKLHIERPPGASDILVSSTDPTKVISHPNDPGRLYNQPRVHIGPIASANRLLKNPLQRDAIRDRFGVKAIEMEGSGIADDTWIYEVGYLVVRGICDYADANKNDMWQEYAAIVAAAYTRALLEVVPSLNY